MSTEYLCPACGNPTQQILYTNDVQCAHCASLSGEDLSQQLRASDLEPDKFLAKIAADSRRSFFRTAAYLCSCVGMSGFLVYLGYQTTWYPQIDGPYEEATGVTLLATIIAGIFLTTVAFQLLRIPTPLDPVIWSLPYRTQIPQEFALPAFPYTLKELEIQRLTSHSFSKVFMFQNKHFAPRGASAYLYDVVVFDQSGRIYDFHQSLSETKSEQQGKQLAEALGVPFERQVTIG
ncbi:MAG: hypothetical protein EP343_09605 [Deltaproteobacteria bacterium]|nr:MAG: hypothetical protein EP343_09605 [Deltaproteobacteria bacterium]